MKVLWTSRGWDQYLFWQTNDPQLLSRINFLIRDIQRSPFKGLGKPEPLRDNLAGWWSRRINDEHRLVYRLAGKGDAQHVEIAQCRFHY